MQAAGKVEEAGDLGESHVLTLTMGFHYSCGKVVRCRYPVGGCEPKSEIPGKVHI